MEFQKTKSYIESTIMLASLISIVFILTLSE